ncbi:MAG: DegT/DnrJ/EryC1/StrS aminotransferase family protein [Pseudomonadota bacterium]
MNIPFIDLETQYQRMKQRIDARVQSVLDHGKYIMGPEVAELEDNLSAYVGCRETITCANGTDALLMALMALEIGPGDAVFTTSFSFFATAEVIPLVGATPVFVDIDSSTYNIDPNALREAVDRIKKQKNLRPRAVISVDLFGLPADYRQIEPLVRSENMDLIEDAAQGFGGSIDSRRAGNFGTVATTSFFPAKPLGCYGDGGALFTNDVDLAEKLRSIRVHGKGNSKYDNVRIGLNSRLDTLQAAILLEKLDIFPEELAGRENVANQYKSALGDHLICPSIPVGFQSSWAQFTVRPKDGPREVIQGSLKKAGVPTSVYYQKPLHRQPAFSDIKWSYDLPNSERAADEVFSLPMHPYVNPKTIRRIAEVVTEIVATS